LELDKALEGCTNQSGAIKQQFEQERAGKHYSNGADIAKSKASMDLQARWRCFAKANNKEKPTK
jgi:hypothetical protein